MGHHEGRGQDNIPRKSSFKSRVQTRSPLAGAHKPATLIAEFANAVISFRRGRVPMKQRVENAQIFLHVCVDVEQGGRESKKRGGETAGTDVGDAQDSAHDVSRVAEVIFLSVTISSIPNL